MMPVCLSVETGRGSSARHLVVPCAARITARAASNAPKEHSLFKWDLPAKYRDFRLQSDFRTSGTVYAVWLSGESSGNTLSWPSGCGVAAAKSGPFGLG